MAKGYVHYIYKIVNVLTNKYYIGMHTTSNIDDGYMGSGKILKRSINKHGIEHHKKIILEYADTREDLIKREIEIVNDELLNDPLSMNIRLGGKGGGGWTSQQQKENNKKSQTAQRKLYEENGDWAQRKREKAKKHFETLRKEGRIPKPTPHTIGEFKHTEKTKKLIGEKNSHSQKGKRNSQYGKCWIYNLIEKKSKSVPKTELNASGRCIAQRGSPRS